MNWECRGPGYRPKRNYQGAIFDAIDRYLSTHAEFLTRSPLEPIIGSEYAEPFVDPPALVAEQPRPRQLKQLLRKLDPVELTFFPGAPVTQPRRFAH